MSRHDWAGNVNHKEWCKKFLQKPKSILENKTYKILKDFEIQTDHLIPTRRPDQVIISKQKREFAA